MLGASAWCSHNTRLAKYEKSGCALASSVSRKFMSSNTVGRVPRAIEPARFARPTDCSQIYEPRH